jgi:uncharacterized protein
MVAGRRERARAASPAAARSGRAARTVLATLLLLAGVARGQQAWVAIDGVRYAVEIADDDAERVRGLTFREHLAPGGGMLFVYPDEAPRGYWMKNTRIALDILYFDGEGRLVAQHRDVPPCTGRVCPRYPSGRPARYVLELAAGQAARLGLREGAQLVFGPGVADPR